ncbi:MAG: hypothetical protein KF752_14750 [Pirellulaceae bacterium]|nr:hypothetical protein [Pirellulaceae bacterium]
MYRIVVGLIFILSPSTLLMAQISDGGYGSYDEPWLPPRWNQSDSGGIELAGVELFGADKLRDSDNRPRIPEPMVFDLVRPLGAQRGEAEINVLAIVPWHQRKRHAEWAPEIEFAIRDGVALEFELPFEEGTLESYKFAGQVTFGTALGDRFIHGAQSILLYNRKTHNWSPTILYLMGMEFDRYWSALAMVGVDTEINGPDRQDRTRRLFNLSVFRHLTDHATLGFETNGATSLGGRNSLLLMPQLHWEWRDNIMLQTGTGVFFNSQVTSPESAFRLIYTF